jgi:alpha-tubulin suppressor-like RCC1 family protein
MGGTFGLALQNGGVVSWGTNTFGQLGNGTFGGGSATAQPVTGLSGGVTAIGAGSIHGVALQNGGLVSWGSNVYSQLGNGTSDSNVPVPVTGMSNGVTALSVGGFHNLALKGGALYAWGNGSDSALGTGSTANASVALPVVGMSNGVTVFSAGYTHSMAVQNGNLFTWGSNNRGQLGNGSNTASTVPVATGLTGVTSVSAGGFHSLAVKNGNVYAWGWNFFGQLGDGTTNSSPTPELIDPTDLHDITAVVAGYYSSYALSGDGSLWVWGYNADGQLGLGTPTANPLLTPQHLLPPSGFTFTAMSASKNGGAEMALVPEPGSLAAWAAVAAMLRRRRRRGDGPLCRDGA